MLLKLQMLCVWSSPNPDICIETHFDIKSLTEHCVKEGSGPVMNFPRSNVLHIKYDGQLSLP